MDNSIDFDGGLTCALSVKNFDSALDWYQSVLGFELVYRKDDIRWAELRSSVANVNIGISETETGGASGGATLTFGVKDIVKARDYLNSRKVRLDGDIIDIPDMVRLLTFFDPEGNALMFYEAVASRRP
jgi:catechol 2,3-dioxygenase-like lactoylglutathione lyase family enzyme